MWEKVVSGATKLTATFYYTNQLVHQKQAATSYSHFALLSQRLYPQAHQRVQTWRCFCWGKFGPPHHFAPSREVHLAFLSPYLLGRLWYSLGAADIPCFPLKTGDHSRRRRSRKCATSPTTIDHGSLYSYVFANLQCVYLPSFLMGLAYSHHHFIHIY